MSEYIDRGSYGCVIKPNIKCDGTFGNNNITKFFFDKKEYISEKKNHEKIEKIDKRNSFIVKKITNCKILLTPKIKSKILNLDLCELTSDYVYQITYEYGGIDLFNLLSEKYSILLKINLFVFLQNFANIFDGLSKINKNGLCHFDIKINNILYDPIKNKFKIIDFGFLNNINKYNLFLYNRYLYFPNDTNILMSIINNNNFYKDLKYYKLNTNKLVLILKKYIVIINEIYEKNKNPYFQKLLVLINDIYNYFNIDIFTNFDYTIFEKIYLKQIKLSTIYKDFGNKIDVYMLGILLYEFLLFIFIKLENNPTITKIPLKLFHLIKKMVILNPYDRITIQQATKEFKSIMKK
jgi:serine/threonine protein kinase